MTTNNGETGSTAALDCAEAFDKDKCAALVAAVMAAFGFTLEDARSKKGGEPARTLRQVARLAALERGFDVACVAAVCGCSAGAVRWTEHALAERVGRQQRGKARNGYDEHPVEPVLAKGRAAAAEWACARQP
jgi:hypothetical protein